MNYRKSILITQLQNKRKVEVEGFMDDFSISLRTLKNDIEELNLGLGKNYIHLIKGYMEVMDYDEFLNVSNQMMKQTDFYCYKMSKSERTTIESVLMLFTPTYVTANDFSEQLSLSRGTILNDMHTLRFDLKPYSLKLISRTNHGFTIHGDEKKIREYIDMLLKVNDSDRNNAYGTLLDQLICGDIDSDDISKELIRSMERCNIILNDDSYRQILNYILIMIRRLLKGKRLKGQPIHDVDPLHQAFLETVAQKYVDRSEITVDEVYAFEEKLRSVTTLKSSYLQENAQTNEHMKISAFVWGICNHLDILEQFGYDNYKVLYSHIVSTIYHLKSNMSIQKNPLYEELEQMYPHIFTCIEEHIHIIEEIIGKKMDRNDISYIAMHIASVTECKEDANEPLHAILVCPTGRCVSLLLKARVLKYFRIVIDDVIPVYKITQKINADFIISTVPLKHKDCPIIVVNQMFLQADIEKMQEFIQKIYKLAKEKTTIKKIEDYVHEYQMIPMDTIKLEEEITALNMRYKTQGENQEKQYFYRMLKEEHILMDYDAKDWMDAIRVSGDILMKSEHLSKHYIEKMIQLIEENGPYIVFEPGFVIAHAGPQDGAHRLGISLVRLKHEIQFEKNGTNVKFIICLSIPDKESHVFLMFQMYKCLINRQIFGFLSEAKTKEEIRSILRIFELDSEDT